MDKKTQQKLVAFLLLLLITLAVQWARERRKDHPPPAPGGPADTRPADPDRPAPQPPPPSGEADPSVHLTLGNPSGATDDETNADNFLMRKPHFALSYNSGKGGPNWVSWCLKDSDFGPAAWADFYPDPELPGGFTRVYPGDYTKSGFDRGHLCPRSDRTSTPVASRATFVMSNIVPQAPHLNQRAWNDLEDYCRGLVRGKSRAAYIVAGQQGVGGEGTNGRADNIARGKVAVPAKCWKVVLTVEGGPGGADDIPKVTSSSRVIAVVMPNDQTVGHGWAKYRTSVNEVETLTGYKFFDKVPPSVADPFKAKVDDEHVAPTSAPRTGD